MADVKLRKKKLQDDLELLEQGFQSRVTRIRSGVPGAMIPFSFIREKPIAAVGVALIAGLAAGLLTGKKSRVKRESTRSVPEIDIGFSSILIGELKKLAARRAAGYLSELLEQKISEKK